MIYVPDRFAILFRPPNFASDPGCLQSRHAWVTEFRYGDVLGHKQTAVATDSPYEGKRPANPSCMTKPDTTCAVATP